jgi:TonB family protein
LQILPHYREQTQALIDSDLHSTDPDQRNRALHWRADLAPADRTAAAPANRSPPPGGEFTGELEPGVYRAENGVSRPTLRAQTEPKYSKLATKLRVEGVVAVQAVITPEGTARSLQVVKPMGFGLDESALAAVLQWQFNPGMKDGNPVSVAATVEVKFRLNHPPGDSNTWYAGPIAFAPLAGVTAPVVVDGTMPKATHETADESVVLEFTVDARGAVSKMSALHGTEPSAELLASYLSKWKFRPAMKSGQAVEAVGRVRFYKGQGDQPNPQNP